MEKKILKNSKYVKRQPMQVLATKPVENIYTWLKPVESP